MKGRYILSKTRLSSSPHPIASIQGFRKRLLTWFRREQRDLPWRHTDDPYRVWVSEIMLQQTQIATVLPYYRRFLRSFPTVQKLAAASERKVLASWAGLGYYSRARNMHHAARIVVGKFGGRFPDHPEALRELPGIGRYTMGAILSIAFKKRFPVVDGNVERVLSRILLLRGNLRTASHQKLLWSVAGRLVPSKSPGDFNQAIMELGATICLPRRPQCGRCPVETFCAARKRGVETELPESQRSLQVKDIFRLTVVLQDKDNRVLLTQRRDKTLMRDFWEFPSFDATQRQSSRTVITRLRRNLQLRFGVPIAVNRTICSFKHTITFRRIHVQAFLAVLQISPTKLSPDGSPIQWVPVRSLKKHLFDSASLRILSAFDF